jgi:hypothetical protein
MDGPNMPDLVAAASGGYTAYQALKAWMASGAPARWKDERDAILFDEVCKIGKFIEERGWEFGKDPPSEAARLEEVLEEMAHSKTERRRAAIRGAAAQQWNHTISAATRRYWWEFVNGLGDAQVELLGLLYSERAIYLGDLTAAAGPKRGLGAFGPGGKITTSNGCFEEMSELEAEAVEITLKQLHERQFGLVGRELSVKRRVEGVEIPLKAGRWTLASRGLQVCEFILMNDWPDDLKRKIGQR